MLDYEKTHLLHDNVFGKVVTMSPLEYIFVEVIGLVKMVNIFIYFRMGNGYLGSKFMNQ